MNYLAHVYLARHDDAAMVGAMLGDFVKANDLGLTSGVSDTPRLEDMSLEDVESFLIKKALSRFDGKGWTAVEYIKAD